MKIKKPKKSTILITIITLAYAILSFINLGSFTNPQTFWHSKMSSEAVTLKLDSPHTIVSSRTFSGIGFGDYLISFSNDNVTYTNQTTLKTDKVFAWKEDKYYNTTAQYIKIEAQKSALDLGEIGFFDIDGNLLNATPTNENAKLILDEQSVVPDHISYMNSTYFDEVYFPRTAYEHLHGLSAYEWTHPPLGKLIMAIPIALFGMTPFAYRVLGNIAGILMLPTIYMLGKLLFKKSKYGILAAAIFALDGMHFVQTRIGTVDSYLVLFILLEYLFMFKYVLSKDMRLRKRLLYLFLSGLFMAFGMATKWTGVFAGIGLALIFFGSLILEIIEKKKWTKQFTFIILFCILFFIIIPLAIYVLSFIPFFTIENPPIKDFKGFIDWQLKMYNYHHNLNATHSYSSPWYTWPITQKSVLFWTGKTPEGSLTRIALLGNPLIFWISVPCMVYVLMANRKINYWFLIFAILSMYVPYIGITRIMFLYHYFPILPFAILCIVAFMSWFCDKINSNIPMYILILAFLIVFVMFYPIYSGWPTNAEYIKWLQWLPTWVW